jgi:hypothetical protein
MAGQHAEMVDRRNLGLKLYLVFTETGHNGSRALRCSARPEKKEKPWPES